MAEPLPSPTSQESQGDYLSVAQVAQRLGCSVSLVQKWRRLGWLAATRLGPPDVPVYGYHPSDVERFARERWNRRRGRPPKDAARAPEPAASRPPAPAHPARPGHPAPLPATTSVHVHAPPPLVRSPAAVLPVGVVAGQPPAPQQRPLTATAPHTAPARPAMPPTATAPAPASGRPLVLWDGDPSGGTALVLARFPAGQVDEALRVAAMWARRYGSLALSEATFPGERPHVLARWQDGVQVSA